jgi:hypothetical protein
LKVLSGHRIKAESRSQNSESRREEFEFRRKTNSINTSEFSEKQHCKIEKDPSFSICCRNTESLDIRLAGMPIFYIPIYTMFRRKAASLQFGIPDNGGKNARPF